MRALILVAGAALALSACSGKSSENADSNTLEVNTLVVDNAASLESLNGVDANAAIDADTANAMAHDANTNDPDTNLANGM
ncbi:MAG: hypothetical protein ABIQ32_05470 [Sphingomicrobium sp.]